MIGFGHRLIDQFTSSEAYWRRGTPHESSPHRSRSILLIPGITFGPRVFCSKIFRSSTLLLTASCQKFDMYPLCTALFCFPRWKRPSPRLSRAIWRRRSTGGVPYRNTHSVIVFFCVAWLSTPPYHKHFCGSQTYFLVSKAIRAMPVPIFQFLYN